MLNYPISLAEERVIHWVSRVGVTLALALIMLQSAITIAWSVG